MKNSSKNSQVPQSKQSHNCVEKDVQSQETVDTEKTKCPTLIYNPTLLQA